MPDTPVDDGETKIMMMILTTTGRHVRNIVGYVRREYECRKRWHLRAHASVAWDIPCADNEPQHCPTRHRRTRPLLRSVIVSISGVREAVGVAFSKQQQTEYTGTTTARQKKLAKRLRAHNQHASH